MDCVAIVPGPAGMVAQSVDAINISPDDAASDCLTHTSVSALQPLLAPRHGLQIYRRREFVRNKAEHLIRDAAVHALECSLLLWICPCVLA